MLRMELRFWVAREIEATPGMSGTVKVVTAFFLDCYKRVYANPPRSNQVDLDARKYLASQGKEVPGYVRSLYERTLAIAREIPCTARLEDPYHGRH